MKKLTAGTENKITKNLSGAPLTLYKKKKNLVNYNNPSDGRVHRHSTGGLGDEEKDDYEIQLQEQNTNRHVDNSYYVSTLHSDLNTLPSASQFISTPTIRDGVHHIRMLRAGNRPTEA